MTKVANFLGKFNRELDKMTDISTDSAPPRYWLPSGNYVQNYVLSGHFDRAFPQGRIISFAGPSGSGKSYNVAAACAQALREGYMVLALDSEDALDDDYMQGCGVDTESDLYNYVKVITISQVVKVVSTFLKQYTDAFGESEDAPKVLIVIDSLNMLMTDTELDNVKKGISKGDQGQQNKQLKAMLKATNQLISGLNVTVIVTSQVYKNQDVTNGEGVWIVGEAVRYAASMIAMVTKLKLRDGADTRGIRMRVEGNKTRFTKPFQMVTIELDYENGIDACSGLVDVAIALGVLEKKGSRVCFAGEEKSHYASAIIANHLDELLEKLNAVVEQNSDLFIEIDENEQDVGDDGESARSRRQSRDIDDIDLE